jgi:hypothetical protein
MSSSQGDGPAEPIGKFMNPNERQPCPQCAGQRTMKFVFPAPRNDPCEEKHAWRFQRCKWCGWTGDVVTGEFAHISWAGTFLIVNGHFYAKGLRQYFEEHKLCDPSPTTTKAKP